jgi:hypothetical protein
MESWICPPIGGRVGIDLPLVEGLRLTYPAIDGELNLSSHWWPVESVPPLVAGLGMTSYWWRGWDWPILPLMESWICPPIGGRVGIDLPLVEGLRLTYPSIDGELNLTSHWWPVESVLPLVEELRLTYPFIDGGLNLSSHWRRVESVLPLVVGLGMTSHWWPGREWPPMGGVTILWLCRSAMSRWSVQCRITWPRQTTSASMRGCASAAAAGAGYVASFFKYSNVINITFCVVYIYIYINLIVVFIV